MSESLANFLRISLPFSFFTSMVRLRLLRLSQTYPDDSPLTTASQERMTSPTPGRSILMTSAPMSASRQVANGPERTCSKARIFTPSRARFGFTLLATLTSFRTELVPVVPAVPFVSVVGIQTRKQVGASVLLEPLERLERNSFFKIQAQPLNS